MPIPEDLLDTLDRYSKEAGQSRSAFIREACAEYVARSRDEELRRQYVEGYREHPESAADSEWRTRNAAAVWGDENWTEEDL